MITYIKYKLLNEQLSHLSIITNNNFKIERLLYLI